MTDTGPGGGHVGIEDVKAFAAADLTKGPSMYDETDLLPCPFCGKSPRVEMTGFHGGGRTIRCETDNCMGPHTTAACIDDAVIQWNRRPFSAATTRNETLKKMPLYRWYGEDAIRGWLLDSLISLGVLEFSANDEMHPISENSVRRLMARSPQVTVPHD